MVEDKSLHGLIGMDTASLLHSEKMLAFNNKAQKKQKLNILISLY